MRVLHLEDDADDAIIIQLDMQRLGVHATFVPAGSREEFTQALSTGTYDVVIVDNSVPCLRAPQAIALAKSVHPHVPVIVCSGAAREADVAESLAAGAGDYVLKDHTWQLAAALRRIAATPTAAAPELPRPALLMLVEVVQKLSMARDLDMIIDIVRHAAHELTDWARQHECTREELQLLEVLTNATAVAIENLTGYENLEHQVRECTAQLERANQELAAFSCAVSHDLRAITAGLDDASSHGDVLQPASVAKLRRNAQRMGSRIDDLLRLSQAGHVQLALDHDLGATDAPLPRCTARSSQPVGLGSPTGC
jgi:CheY-like chemotaxis protein